MKPPAVYQLWPEVNRFYAECVDDEQRLKQRIRRALEKCHMEAKPFEELAEMLFEKIMPCVKEMVK